MVDRERKGFTTSELLVATLILALLLSIAFASISSYTASLAEKRLNSAAEELFLFAQNRLYAQKLSGAAGGASFPERDYSALSADPNGTELERLVFDVGGKSALLEYDLSRGDILGAYYSESLSKDELAEKCLSLSGEERLSSLGIGYYGSDDRSILPGGGESIKPREEYLAPIITVDNGEELRLFVECEVENASSAGYSVYLFLSNGEETLRAEPETLPSIVGDRLFADFKIDEIESGGSLYAQNYGKYLGLDEITAKVYICEQIGELTEKTSLSAAERAKAVFSPIFASQKGNEVEISNLRHLNNLRLLEDGGLGKSVVQTEDIDFGGRGDISPLPIFCGSFDGRGNMIKNVNFESGGESFGLFEEIGGKVKNLHICGERLYETGSAAVGGICGRLTEGGELYNCSVSGAEIDCGESAERLYIGGLAGEARGKISSCSAAAKISSSAEGEVFAGGLFGLLCGEAEYSHSTGSIELSGGKAAAGISADGGGKIKNCYSTVWTKYLGGADFFGVAGEGARAENCFFLAENSWLALDSDGEINADGLETLSLEGFGKTENIESGGRGFPESVKVGGIYRAFSSGGPIEPRGLIGIVKARYSAGKFEYETICCFDAYGNEPRFYPEIEWESAGEGEERLYFFRSALAEPRGGTFGWEISFAGGSNLCEEEAAGRYICREIKADGAGDLAALRFGSVVKEAEIEPTKEPEAPEPAEPTVGALGIIYRGGGITLDPTTFLPVEVGPYYEYFYCICSPGGGEPEKGYITAESAADGFAGLAPGGMFDGEIKLYVFCESGAAGLLGESWSFNAAPASSVSYAGESGGYAFYEAFDGYYFDRVTAEFFFGGRRAISITARLEYLGLSSAISFDITQYYT